MILCGLLSGVSASAEENIVPPEAQKIIEQSGTSADDAAAWSLGGLLKKVVDYFTDGIKAPLQFLFQSSVYLFLACVAGLVVDAHWKKYIDVIVVLGFGVINLASVSVLLEDLTSTAQSGQTYLIEFIPVYSGIAMLGGQPAGAAAYGGFFLTVATFLSGTIEKIILPIVRMYFCFVVSASIWGNKGVEEAAGLFLRCLKALLKWAGLLLSFTLGLQSILTATTDSAALKMGKGLLSTVVPVVGSAASAALESAYAALHLLKGSLALAAVVSLSTLFAPLLISCLLYSAAFCLLAILASALGQAQCGQLCKLYAGGTEVCFSALTLYYFIVLLATVLLLMAGGGG